VVRALGLLMLLVAVLMPVRTRAAGPTSAAPATGPRIPGVHVESADRFALADDDELEGGACGDEHEQVEELVDCGAELSFFERPALLDVLGGALERMQADKCLTLLDILFEREACHRGGRECGDVLPLALPPPAIKSLSSSAGSGQVSPTRAALADDAAARARVRASDSKSPLTRSIAPPDRPPR
jgi:hypothetical protein